MAEKINRERFLAHPEDEEIIRQRREVIAILRGFANGNPRERVKYNRSHQRAEMTLDLATGDRETVRRHDGDPGALPYFQHGSLYYFELVLSYVTDRPMS